MTQPLPPLPPIPEAPRPRKTWLARHRTPLVVSVTALAAIAAGIGVAFAAVGASGTTQGAASTSTPPASTAPGSGAPSSAPAQAAARARKGVRATIETESPTTWTVRTRAGQSVVVTITPQTQFGTLKAPATRSQFTPGKSVVILGTVSNGAMTATRIAVPASGAGKAMPSPTPTTS